MGLALAQRLSEKGHLITVFERDKQLGGLSTFHDYGTFIWDRFYHVILPSDSNLIDFIKGIGLGDKLHWRRTLTGFYVDRQFYSMSNSLEFLRFPPLNILEKIRLALTILYCARIKNWQRLDKIPLQPWLVKSGGRSTFEKLWKPLLIAKLGENYHRVSALFIWSYIKRMFSARHSSASREQLGYIQGGYKSVFERLNKLIVSAGSNVYTNISIEHIKPLPTGGLFVEYAGESKNFEKVIFTGRVDDLQRVVSDELLTLTVKNQSVEYLGVICVILISRKALIPYYVLNIADERVPFTGIIGLSNVVPPEETEGFHITFLPKYVHSEDPLLQHSDDGLCKQFYKGLQLMFPDLKQTDIEYIQINRAYKVQPLQVLNYSSLFPKIATKHDDFFILNTSQFVDDTLNNNSVVRHFEKFLKEYGQVFGLPGCVEHK